MKLVALFLAMLATPALAQVSNGKPAPPWAPEPSPGIDIESDNRNENTNLNENNNSASGGNSALTLVNEVEPRVRLNLGAGGSSSYTQVTAQCVAPVEPRLKRNGDPKRGLFNRANGVLGLWTLGQATEINAACVRRLEEQAATDHEYRMTVEANEHEYRMQALELERRRFSLEVQRYESCRL